MNSEQFPSLSATKLIFLTILLFQLPFLKPTSSALAVNPLCDRPSSFSRPSRLLDQHFGLALDPEDLLEPFIFPRWFRSYAGYLRPWRTDASEEDEGSSVRIDKDKFEASLDVQQFKPDEISVKLADDNSIKIEGKHEEKQDEHGYISRHFVRRYVLPDNVDVGRIESKLSSDGILTISAPTHEAKQVEHRDIPIQQTGEPAKRIQHSEEPQQQSEEQSKKTGGNANEL